MFNRKRIEAAAISGVRVFFYAALTTWIGMTAAGGTADIPDLNGLKRTGLACLWSGVTALTAFAWNLLRPRTDIQPAK